MTSSFGEFDDKIWARLKKDLKKTVGDTAYNNWLKQITFLSIEEQTISFSVPTKFLRDWVVNNYADKIKNQCKKHVENIDAIKFVVKPLGGRVVPGTARIIKQNDSHWKNSLDIRNSQYPSSDNEFGAPLDPRFTFDNFVVGKPNELAFAASQRVAESEKVHFNPLFLYGGVGLGKTHLMHAIGWKIKERNPERKVIYLSAEKFMYQFVRALRYKDTSAFKEQFRSIDVLMIDDVQFISGKDNTQEEFFHTFNALIEQNRQIVISADKSPSDLDGVQERLKSRLGCGLVADIHPTTYELRLGILIEKAQKRGVEIPSKVLEFLSHRIVSNVREMEGALNRLVAHATLVGTSITVETAQSVLQDLLKSNSKRITIEEIQKKVAEHFNIRLTDMHSPRRSRSVARPRQIAMYLAKSITSRSLPEIGRKFGGRDHTTVMHAVKKIEELKFQDNNFNEDIELLKRLIDS
ncbi:MAG: Chromosomal replication initiator protein DnaA [Alphaproteobacteria bacterium MarineAlpha5_Bin8]|nr:MAG: Chromosomal replication initiator protein DnaA [Alphaproteobacteria bacterium MarineAlpha5_Bin7]PPR48211.1 MAG: Chromosomal replication initiator protein DnaA [Alphaproteobacteria bacterium MarineAlpha5_Bin8]PPR52862.1 MAG: Chromosomal replication initiator protein DnaA [Alphaproteobacteria bacterium MarineAlpha5_Bin6]|tara:strand:- start:567 stop:1961 length:1395 start_codon:yes stop_codon:yes gene_type:complete